METKLHDHDIKWRLPEVWTLVHSNGRRIRVDLAQDANTLVGTAQGCPDERSTGMKGTMSGSVDGDTITMTVYWPDKSIGEYSGMVDGNGRAAGTAADRSDRGATMDWSGEPALTVWK